MKYSQIMKMDKFYVLCLFVCMTNFYAVVASDKTNVDKSESLISILRSRRDQPDDTAQNRQTDTRENIADILNVLKKDDKLERELDILRNWQTLSGLVKDGQDATNTGDDAAQDDLGKLQRSNKRRVRRSPFYNGWWWGRRCPSCDQNKVVNVPGCSCPIGGSPQLPSPSL